MAKKQYDYLVVGSGLFGATFAFVMAEKGKKVLVMEKRNHIGGNAYTETIDGINVHRYGPHIFHTSDKDVWAFVRRFAEFNNFVNSPLASYRGELWNLPFNMNTFYRLWGTATPEEAQKKLASQIAQLNIAEPKNLEEQALILVGPDVYERFVKGYTEKQWGRKCIDLPASIIKRLPCRFTFDNNYFTDRYQGVPIGGYTPMVEKMLKDVDVITGVDYFDCKEGDFYAKKTVYTGMIDRFFGYVYGKLQYRSLFFETKTINQPNYQGVAVINYTDRHAPYTRIIEHKHFEFGTQDRTVISFEYPAEWKEGMEPYYPIGDKRNTALYRRYADLARSRTDVIFGGRLGAYRYYDMDRVIRLALDLGKKELSNRGE